MYSTHTLELFNNAKCLYVPGQPYDFMGYGGDLGIGEYVHLYFNMAQINHESLMDSNIFEARFSAIGGVILIAAAEALCRAIDNGFGMSINNALTHCNKLADELGVCADRIHGINFVIQAFYGMIENFMAVKNDSTR